MPTRQRNQAAEVRTGCDVHGEHSHHWHNYVAATPVISVVPFAIAFAVEFAFNGDEATRRDGTPTASILDAILCLKVLEQVLIR